ncbi:MAG: hypothetical protein Q8N18_04230 [Opitutaceae bacterium]|nr:hypothetical protein [Opitutaceae bacterium]
METIAAEADQVKAAQKFMLTAMSDAENWMNENPNLRIREK